MVTYESPGSQQCLYSAHAAVTIHRIPLKMTIGVSQALTLIINI